MVYNRSLKRDRTVCVEVGNKPLDNSNIVTYPPGVYNLEFGLPMRQTAHHVHVFGDYKWSLYVNVPVSAGVLFLLKKVSYMQNLVQLIVLRHSVHFFIYFKKILTIRVRPYQEGNDEPAGNPTGFKVAERAK